MIHYYMSKQVLIFITIKRCRIPWYNSLCLILIFLGLFLLHNGYKKYLHQEKFNNNSKNKNKNKNLKFKF